MLNCYYRRYLFWGAMKRLFAVFLLVFMGCNIVAPVLAAEQEVITADIQEKDVFQVRTTKTKYIEGKILDSDPDRMKLVLKLQKEKDVEDLECLWKATVDRNSAIRFALQKLSIPDEIRPVFR